MEFDKAYFDAGLERRGTDCMKWDGMMEEHRDPDMVPMWVADMDFPSAPAIRKAVQKVVDQGTWGYTMSGEADACALRDYWKRRHGVGFEPKDVQMGPCVVSELRLCVRALTEPGDGVLIFTPQEVNSFAIASRIFSFLQISEACCKPATLNVLLAAQSITASSSAYSIVSTLWCAFGAKTKSA